MLSVYIKNKVKRKIWYFCQANTKRMKMTQPQKKWGIKTMRRTCKYQTLLLLREASCSLPKCHAVAGVYNTREIQSQPVDSWRRPVKKLYQKPQSVNSYIEVKSTFKDQEAEGVPKEPKPVARSLLLNRFS